MFIFSGIINAVALIYMLMCSKTLSRYNPMVVTKTGFIKYVLLNFVTCGIYGVYFGYKIGDEVCEVGHSFGVKTILRGWLALLLLSGQPVFAFISSVLAILNKDDGSILSAFLTGSNTLITAIASSSSAIFLFLLIRDMKKIKSSVPRNISTMANANMQAVYIKQSGKIANKAAKQCSTGGKKVATQVVNQQMCEVEEQVTNALSDTTSHVAALEDMRRQLEEGRNGNTEE